LLRISKDKRALKFCKKRVCDMLIDVISLLTFLVIPFPKRPWTVHGISAHYIDAMFFISIERICCMFASAHCIM